MTAEPSATNPAERAIQIRPATAADAAFVGSFVSRFAESGALPWRDPALMAEIPCERCGAGGGAGPRAGGRASGLDRHRP